MHLGSPILKAEPYRQGCRQGSEVDQGVPRAGARHQVPEHGRRVRHQLPQGRSPARERIRRGHFAGSRRRPVASSCSNRGGSSSATRESSSAESSFTKSTGGKHYVIQDAAMNDLIRPTLYGSFHRVWPVDYSRAAGTPRGRHGHRHRQGEPIHSICPIPFGRTWSDRCANRAIILAKDRPLPDPEAGRSTRGIHPRVHTAWRCPRTTIAGCARPKFSLQAAHTD